MCETRPFLSAFSGIAMRELTRIGGECAWCARGAEPRSREAAKGDARPAWRSQAAVLPGAPRRARPGGRDAGRRGHAWPERGCCRAQRETAKCTLELNRKILNSTERTH